MAQKVYVLESRRKGRMGPWSPERSDCGWGAWGRIRELRRLYIANNPKHDWRVVAYTPPGRS
jgi:hypothetical protein